jgi:hypothetical protein
MPDLSIVIVNWNVCDLLRRCLASLPAATGSLECEVFVVDNASTDDSAAMVRSEFPHVTLIVNAENQGFTRANNQAIDRSAGRYVVLLNPDTEAAPNALATMAAYMDAHTDVGVVGPRLLYGDGSIQSSRRRFPTLATLFVESTVLQRVFRRSALIKRYYILDRPNDQVQDVDWLVGACLAVRRRAIEGAGLLDERFFMYSEEVDWCLRIKQLGWKIVYLPTASVTHHEARSSEQAPASQHIHFHTSRVTYAHKHFGTRQARILRVFLLSSYAYLLLEESAKWLLGHKRALRAHRLRVYRDVLLSGLRVSMDAGGRA